MTPFLLSPPTKIKQSQPRKKHDIKFLYHCVFNSRWTKLRIRSRYLRCSHCRSCDSRPRTRGEPEYPRFAVATHILQSFIDIVMKYSLYSRFRKFICQINKYYYYVINPLRTLINSQHSWPNPKSLFFTYYVAEFRIC